MRTNSRRQTLPNNSTTCDPSTHRGGKTLLSYNHLRRPNLDSPPAVRAEPEAAAASTSVEHARYYCKFCDKTFSETCFRNVQQFGAHCSNCSRGRKYARVSASTALRPTLRQIRRRKKIVRRCVSKFRNSSPHPRNPSYVSLYRTLALEDAVAAETGELVMESGEGCLSVEPTPPGASNDGPVKEKVPTTRRERAAQERVFLKVMEANKGYKPVILCFLDGRFSK